MFTSLKKRKELIDRELEVYRKEKVVEITLDIAEKQQDAAKDNKEFEHEYHSKRQELETELALIGVGRSNLQSTIELLEEKIRVYVSEYNSVCAAKDKTIEVLERALENLTNKIPTELSTTTINNK